MRSSPSTIVKLPGASARTMMLAANAPSTMSSSMTADSAMRPVRISMTTRMASFLRGLRPMQDRLNADACDETRRNRSDGNNRCDCEHEKNDR